MLTVDEARTRVARGAAHLDRHRPGWHERIDVGTLRLASCHACILGQLGGSWGDLLITAGGEYLSGTDGGFCAEGDFDGFTGPGIEWVARRETAYGLLQDAWIAAIADRLVTSPAVSDPVVVVPEEA